MPPAQEESALIFCSSQSFGHHDSLAGKPDDLHHSLAALETRIPSGVRAQSVLHLHVLDGARQLPVGRSGQLEHQGPEHPRGRPGHGFLAFGSANATGRRFR